MEVGIAAGLALGIFISYAPQQFLIAMRKSTEGINPYFLMLMNLGSSFAFSNVLILSRPIVGCCKTSISPFDCFGSILGTLQLFAGLLGPTILLFLGVRFREPGEAGQAMKQSAVLVGIVNLASWILAFSVTDLRWRRHLATLFGLAALCVGLVQYLPQIATTYRLKHTGSLSILMLLIQIPGGYAWCLSLAMRKDSHWSTWISLFMAADFQLLLLIMALYYTKRGTHQLAAQMAAPPPSLSAQHEADTVPVTNEAEPLLPH